ncbi:hypothetical protein TREAZ_1850 [Leadbettera azotonutricia ZAS-9]|uniref:Uncharacterized protein n=1 Tax=Leadbettera azotonutricia (strain ATCC BAA-888 / DSM 13862 / ZAS-9) TaxID=545695 RepID=F5YBF8_LEAAZ|nr:hypothetical protein TREAZ_1850 [Leadbettera azotonutricia ZAS-9]
MPAGTINNFYASLEIMWKGMLGLFLVCGALAIVIMIVAKICTPKKKDSTLNN